MKTVWGIPTPFLASTVSTQSRSFDQTPVDTAPQGWSAPKAGGLAPLWQAIETTSRQGAGHAAPGDRGQRF